MSWNFTFTEKCMCVCRICYCGVLNKNSLCPIRVKRAERLNGVGSRGRAPGSSWVFRVLKTPKCLSSHSFSFISKTSFSAKSFDIVRYKMMLGLMIKAHSLCSDIGFFIGIQRRESGFDIKEWFAGAHRGCLSWMCLPLEKPDFLNFFFLNVLFCFKRNRAIWWILSGANIRTGYEKKYMLDLTVFWENIAC